MIYAITKYAPLDIDSLLSNYSRTLDNNGKDFDFLYLFNHNIKDSDAKVTVVFNSHEYCLKRNLTILDGNQENIVDVVDVLKKSIK